MKADPALARLTCFIDSNGCLDDGIHRAMTGRSNEQVLRSIELLHGMGLLYEVRLLLLAGTNDDPGLIRRTAEWLAAVDPAMRVKVIGFRAHGARPHTPALVEPTPAQLDDVTATLQAVAPFDVCVV